jgi:hypothetical protein
VSTVASGKDLEVVLRWLGGEAPSAPCEVSWGVPWPKGVLRDERAVRLVSGDGSRLASQTWLMASWPDGSVKWTGHAARFGREQGSALRLVVGQGERADGGGGAGAHASTGEVHSGALHGGAPDGGALEVAERSDAVVIDTGPLHCELARTGPVLVRELSLDGGLRCCGVRLVAERERRRGLPTGEERVRARATGVLSALAVEQSGPLRLVVRAEGTHRVEGATGFQSWLPFVVRLYFYRGSKRVRIVHTFIVDGDPQVDFCCGIGLEAAVPLTGPAYNRQVRFAGEGGFFAEPAQLLWTWRGKDAGGLYGRQLAGEALDLSGAGEAFGHSTGAGGGYGRLVQLMGGQAVWRSFKLVQASADHFRISKQVREGCAWVNAGEGRRSGGAGGVWGEEGGFAIAVADFWRKAPRSLEIADLGADVAVVRAWLWSPDAEPMDLRHYDTETHVDAAYEGFEELRADARGVANTNEVWLEPLALPRPAEALRFLAEMAAARPQLVCEPTWYHGSGALGVWSLPGENSAARRWTEAQLSAALDFYVDEVEQRRWYGFWDYGDVMHSYDPLRHAWRYDLGGYAWDNTELVPNLWLWYSFLRSGRADVFRAASAMSRHTSEVDVYHAGPYAGLGSRHNVRHWGCGCKEARISMAVLHRPFYYLTTDERAGEVMAEVLANVEAAMVRLDPARTLVPRDDWPTHARTGPDWAALCSNWMTDWERTGNPASLTAIETGIKCLGSTALGMASGPVFGYDPMTKRLEHIGDNNYSYHMVAPFGGPETWMELARLLPGSGLAEMLCDLASYAAMSAEQREVESRGVLGAENWSQTGFYARLLAFAAATRVDPALAARAWAMLVGEGSGLRFPIEPRQVPLGEAFRPLREIPWVSTGTFSQWSLNVVECLELAPDALEAVWEGLGLGRELAGEGQRQAGQ